MEKLPSQAAAKALKRLAKPGFYPQKQG